MHNWVAHSSAAIVSIACAEKCVHNKTFVITASTDMTAQLWTLDGTRVGIFGQVCYATINSCSILSGTFINKLVWKKTISSKAKVRDMRKLWNSKNHSSIEYRLILRGFLTKARDIIESPYTKLRFVDFGSEVTGANCLIWWYDTRKICATYFAINVWRRQRRNNDPMMRLNLI